MQRRIFLRASAALAAAGFPAQSLLAAAASSPLQFLWQAQPFDYARLKGRARALAAQAYDATEHTILDEVGKLDWDQRLHAPTPPLPVTKRISGFIRLVVWPSPSLKALRMAQFEVATLRATMDIPRVIF